MQSHYWQYRLYRRLNLCTPDSTRENEKETVAPVRVESFDLKDVCLLPSRFRDNMLRDSAWMTSIDVSRLLHSFRTNAGVFAGREGGYMTVKNSVAGNPWTVSSADILPDICFRLTL